MSNDKLEKYKQAVRDVRDAESWNNLPLGKRYLNSTFDIRQQGSKAPILTRHGQRYAGDTNYWESPEGMNRAVLGYLIDNWDGVWMYVLERLKDAERNALINCQSYIDDMQRQIDEARTGVRVASSGRNGNNSGSDDEKR